MRKALKYLLRVTGALLIFLVLFVITLPLLFKNEIIESVRRAISRQIAGELYFEEAKVGVLRTFPNLCLELTSPVLTGGVHPEGDSLLSAESLSIVVDIKSALRSGAPFKIIGIRMSSPRISLYTDTSGVTNYQLITPADSTTTGSSADTVIVEVDDYRIDNGYIKYVDASNGIKILADTVYHQGTLRYQDDHIELRTNTGSGILTIIYDGIAYLESVHVKGSNDLNIDLQKSVYTLLENQFSLNALEVDGKGIVSQTEETTTFNLEFTGARSAFKNLLSLLPNIYTSDFGGLNATGNIALTGTLKGILSAATVPVYNIALQVDKGAFQFPGKPLGFREVAFNGTVYNSSGNWQPVDINLSSLHFLLNNNPFDAIIRIQNPTGKATARGTIKGILDLADVVNAYPMPQVTTLQGIINADVKFDIDASRPAADQKASGRLAMENIAVKAQGEELALQSGDIEFSQTAAHATTQSATLNGSTMQADLTAQNYIGWLTKDEPMTVTGSIALDKFDANRYLTEDEGTQLSSGSTTYDPGLNLIRYDGSLKVNTLIYDTYVIENGSATIDGTLPSLQILQLQGKINGTTFSAQGTLTDVHNYLDDTAPLSGKLDCTLDKVYVDRWIEEDETGGEAAATTSYVALPSDLNFDINFKGEGLLYDDIEIQNPRGSIHLENGILEIHDFKGQGMGGNIAFSGLYNTQNIEHPAFSMKYDLKALHFSDAFRQIGTFQKLAPIVEYVQGVFNSTLVFEGRLGENYFPDLQSLTSSGFLETLTGTLQKAEILDKISQFLNLKKPLRWDLGNTKNWFEIKEGYVTLQEVHKTIDGIEMGISGRHQIQGDMDYLIKLNIPTDRVSSNPVGGLAKAGYEELQKKAAGFGVKLNTIESFIVHVAVRGKLKDPKFEVAFFDASGKTLKETAAAEFEDLKQQAKDTITAIAEEKIEAVRDSLENVIDMAVDSARRAAEEKIKEAGKEVIAETTARLDSTLRDSITNAVLKKVGEKETDKIKDALEKWDPFKKKKKE